MPRCALSVAMPEALRNSSFVINYSFPYPPAIHAHKQKSLIWGILKPVGVRMELW